MCGTGAHSTIWWIIMCRYDHEHSNEMRLSLIHINCHLLFIHKTAVPLTHTHIQRESTFQSPTRTRTHHCRLMQSQPVLVSLNVDVTHHHTITTVNVPNSHSTSTDGWRLKHFFCWEKQRSGASVSTRWDFIIIWLS